MWTKSSNADAVPSPRPRPLAAEWPAPSLAPLMCRSAAPDALCRRISPPHSSRRHLTRLIRQNNAIAAQNHGQRRWHIVVASSSDVSEAAPRHTPYCVTIYAAVHRGLHVRGSHYTSFYAGEGWFPPGLLVASLPLLSLPLAMQFMLLQGLRTSSDADAYPRPNLMLQSLVCAIYTFNLLLLSY